MSDRAPALRAETAQIDAEVDGLTVAAPEEQPASPAEEVGPPPSTITPLDEARAIVNSVVEMAIPFYPTLANVYTPDVREKLASVSAPLLAKYGITLPGFLARWREEIDFLIIAIPLTGVTIQAVRADNAARAKAATEAQTPTPSTTTEPVQ